MALICGLSPTLGTSSLMSLSVSMRKAAPDTLFLLKLSMTSSSTFLSERKLPNSSTVNDSTADADEDAMADSSYRLGGEIGRGTIYTHAQVQAARHICAYAQTPRDPAHIDCVLHTRTRHCTCTRALGIFKSALLTSSRYIKCNVNSGTIDLG